MVRILFLLLIVMSSFAFAQSEKPQAWKFDEFETATNGYVKMKMDAFYTELNNNPTSQGFIINYGAEREIATRGRQIRNVVNWRKYDAARVTLVNGGFREKEKTEFRIVPAGAEKPEPKSPARLFDEFGKTHDEGVKARIQNLYIELMDKPNLRGYIVQSGSTKAVAASEKRIKDIIAYWKLDASKVIFKRAGQSSELKIQFWLAPAVEKTPQTKIYIVLPGSKPPTR